MDSRLGNAESGGGFFVGQSAKKKKLDNLGLAGIVDFEPCESLIQLGQARRRCGADQDSFVESDVFGAPTALLAVSRFGVVDENVSHHPRRDGVKVNPILPIATGICQPQIRLMDQCRCTQSIFAMLGPHAAGSKFSKLIVNQGNQVIEGSPVAPA